MNTKAGVKCERFEEPRRKRTFHPTVLPIVCVVIAACNAAATVGAAVVLLGREHAFIAPRYSARADIQVGRQVAQPDKLVLLFG